MFRVTCQRAIPTLAWRINNRGQVVGIYSDVDRQVPLRFLRGYIYEDGRFIRIDAPRVSNTTLNDINDRSQSVGQAFASADPLNSHYTFLRERDGTFVTLRAFRHDDEEPTRIAVPGAVSTFATAINDRGHIVGYYTDPAPGTTGPSAAAALVAGSADDVAQDRAGRYHGYVWQRQGFGVLGSSTGWWRST